MEYKSVDELLALLELRGLTMADRSAVVHHLQTVGHYRLTTFYESFYIEDKKFDSSIPTFAEDITSLYSFDRRLRLLLLGPLEKVEVALRALLIKEIGDHLLATKGPPIEINLFDTTLYVLKSEQDIRNFEYAKDGCRRGAWNSWIGPYSRSEDGKRIGRIISDKKTNKKDRDRAKAERQRAFEVYYSSLPAWKVLQTASFGPLANIYSALRIEIKVAVAKHFNLHRINLMNIFYALKDLRNACAHHEPVWNWDPGNRDIRLDFPKVFTTAAKIDDGNRFKIYAYCAVIHILLGFLSRGQSTWFRRLKKLINEFNTTYSKEMGFPEHWQTLPFWCVPDVTKAASFSSLRDLIGIYSSKRKALLERPEGEEGLIPIKERS